MDSRDSNANDFFCQRVPHSYLRVRDSFHSLASRNAPLGAEMSIATPKPNYSEAKAGAGGIGPPIVVLETTGIPLT